MPGKKYPLIKPSFYLNLLKEIGQFLKQPNHSPQLHESTREKIYKSLGLLVLKAVFLIPVILFFALIYGYTTRKTFSRKTCGIGSLLWFYC